MGGRSWDGYHRWEGRKGRGGGKGKITKERKNGRTGVIMQGNRQ